MQGSWEHGLIVFSLGSMVDSFGYDQQVASVFSRLPQRVIWRHKGIKPKYIGNNTRMLKLIPQNDLLGNDMLCSL